MILCYLMIDYMYRGSGGRDGAGSARELRVVWCEVKPMQIQLGTETVWGNGHG